MRLEKTISSSQQKKHHSNGINVNQKQQLNTDSSDHVKYTKSNFDKLTDLPVNKVKNELLEELLSNQCTIVIGETGSGKSTQVPQILLDNDPKITIAVTQPRRVAAVTLAKRVSQELGSRVGTQVGYSVRFDQKVSEETKITYLTDGMLLRECLQDKYLTKYTHIILDEAHERTILTDILMAYLKQLNTLSPKLTKRKNKLKLIIMSATLHGSRFSEFFDYAPIMYIPGRQFHVDLFHTDEPVEDYLDAALRTVFQIHKFEASGDILVFLTGQDEIESLESRLQLYAAAMPDDLMKLQICTLYAAMPQESQMKVFKKTPSNHRKVVLATNIAETSITISGLRYVIDCGLAKVRTFNAKTGMEVLEVEPISKSSAAQRAGRAGRENTGKCYRLYTEEDFERLPQEAVPEIHRIDLAQAILILKARGIEDVQNFDFLEPPSSATVIKALHKLWALGALNNKGRLNDIGCSMSKLPLDPSLARCIVDAASSNNHVVFSAVIDTVSCLSSESLFQVVSSDKYDAAHDMRTKFSHKSGDHLTSLICFRKFLDLKATESSEYISHWCKTHFFSRRALTTASDIRNQLREICTRAKYPIEEEATQNLSYKTTFTQEEVDLILKALLSGYILNTAILSFDGSYKSVIKQSKLSIHPSSTLIHSKKSPALFFHEATLSTKAYMRCVSAIPLSWLKEVGKNSLGITSSDNI